MNQGRVEMIQGDWKSGESLMKGSIKVPEGEISLRSTCCEVSYALALQVAGEKIKGVG